MPPVQSRRPHPLMVRSFSLAALALFFPAASAQCLPEPTAKVYPTRPGNEGYFFDPIALSGDWLFIPNGYYPLPDGGVGIVYTYHREPDGTWTPGPELTDPSKNGATFGTSIAIEGDTAAIGMFSSYELVTPGVFVFQRGPDNSWTPGARLMPTDPIGYRSVNVDGFAGDTILIRAQGSDKNGAAGGVYTFRRNAEGRWSQESRLMAFDSKTGYTRGTLSGDRVFVGTSAMPGSPAQLFPFKRNAQGIWEAGDPIPVPDSDGLPAEGATPIFKGSTLAVEADYLTENSNFSHIDLYRVRAGGLTLEASVAPGYSFSSPRFTVADGLLLVARPFDDLGHGLYSGGVEVYTRTGGLWDLSTEFAPPDGEPQDRFGWPLILDSGRAAIVAHGDKQDGLHGSAYIYDLASCGPCAPDCNDDGALDLFDFLCYLNAFAEGDPYANRDGNETFDLFDLLLYVNAFNAGC